MTPTDNQDTNQPEGSRKNGGRNTPKHGWAPPGKKPRAPRTGSLTVGEHIAQLTMIEGKESTVYSGYTVVTNWKTITGLSGTLFINFDDAETREWLIDKNYAHVDAILAAGGMPGETNPNWPILMKALQDTWFSIEVKSAGKGGLYLAKLGAPDEDEDPSGSTTEVGPGPETDSEPEEGYLDEPGPAHAPSHVAEEPRLTVEEIRERAKANRKANRHLYDADADDDMELTSND